MVGIFGVPARSAFHIFRSRFLISCLPLVLWLLQATGCSWGRDNPCDDPTGGGFCLSAGGSSSDWGKDIVVASGGNSYVTGSFSGVASFGSLTLSSRSAPSAPAEGDASDMFLANVNSAGEFRWAVAAGGASADYGNGVAVDSAGNIYVTGSFTGSASFGTHSRASSGLHDVYVAQLSPAGEYRWVVKAGGAQNDYANDIEIDSAGNVYVLGSFYKRASFGKTTLTARGSSFDVFVAQVGPDGKFRWAVSAGGDKDDYGNGIAVDSAGNSTITGIFVGTAVFGAATLTSSSSYFDIFVAQVSPDGKLQWAASAGGPKMDFGNDVVTDSGGNIYVTGEYAGEAAFGSTTLTARGSHDIFVAKVSPAGKSRGRFDWAISAGETQHDYGKGIAVDSGGNLYITGEFSSSAVFGETTLQGGSSGTFFVARLSPIGEGGKGIFTWAVSAGEVASGRGNRVATDNAGSCYVTGELTAGGEKDVLIWKVAPGGK